MSIYIKLEDAIRKYAEMIADMAYWEHGVGNGKPDDEDLDIAREYYSDLPTIEVSEENELKFYYVESIDDYWIGRRLDNFYYAEWSDRLGFVWTHSRYLPWGEHIVDENTLWKEHTYPSEPKEIPFTEWIVGFMKKRTIEDCISRAYLEEQYWQTLIPKEMVNTYVDLGIDIGIDKMHDVIKNAPSVVPNREEGEWIDCNEPPNTERNVFVAHGTDNMKSVCIGHYEHDLKQWYEDKNFFATPIYDGMYWCEIPKFPTLKGADNE